jgi:threonine dehydrogenase-like Zn-dependent dehydrogenase
VFDRELRAFVRPNPPRPAYPAMLGYEMVGVIEEVGSSVAELRVGDPAWDRQRVMRTVVELLAKGRVRVDSLPMREFPFERAVEAYQWLDANPREAVKVALTYEGGNHSGGEQ